MPKQLRGATHSTPTATPQLPAEPGAARIWVAPHSETVPGCWEDPSPTGHCGGTWFYSASCSLLAPGVPRR